VASARDRGGARDGVGSSEKERAKGEEMESVARGLVFSSLSHAQRRTLWHTTHARASHAVAEVWHRSAMTDFKL
jgi:hypothetical protein